MADLSSNPFYVPMPEQPPNLFAAFTSRFIGARTPWTMQRYMMQLQAARPGARDQLLSDLAAQRGALLEELAKTEREDIRAAATMDAALKQLVSSGFAYKGVVKTAEGGVAQANIGLASDVIKAGKLDDNAKDILSKTRGDVKAATVALEKAQASGDQEAYNKATKALQRAVAARAEEARSTLDPLQWDAISREMQDLNGEGFTEEQRATIAKAIGSEFQARPDMAVPKIGIGEDSLGDITREVGDAYNALRGSVGPTETGSVTTSTSTTRPSSSEGGSPQRTTPSTTTGSPQGDQGVRVPPAPGGSSSSAQPIIDELDRLRRLEQEVRAEDPMAHLGAFGSMPPGDPLAALWRRRTGGSAAGGSAPRESRSSSAVEDLMGREPPPKATVRPTGTAPEAPPPTSSPSSWRWGEPAAGMEGRMAPDKVGDRARARLGVEPPVERRQALGSDLAARGLSDLMGAVIKDERKAKPPPDFESTLSPPPEPTIGIFDHFRARDAREAEAMGLTEDELARLRDMERRGAAREGVEPSPMTPQFRKLEGGSLGVEDLFPAPVPPTLADARERTRRRKAEGSARP